MTENNEFGGGAWWIVVLFLFAFMGFGGSGFGGGGIGQQDLQRAIDLNSIQEGQRDIEARVQEIGAENISTIKDVAYNNLGEIRDLQASVSAGFANLQTCCCDMKMEMANNTQKVLDAIAQNKIEELQNKVNTLEMQNAIGQATAGIVRYPMMSTYNSGTNPFCGGCNC